MRQRRWPSVTIVVVVVACAKLAPELGQKASQVRVDRTSAFFGDVEIGATSPPMTFTVMPTADGEVETIETITSDCPQFLVTAPGLPGAEVSRTCSGTGGDGYGGCTFVDKTYQFEVRFAPTVVGPRSCKVLVNFVAGIQLGIDVSGMGIKPSFVVAVGPAAAPFGDIRVGAASDPTLITIRNDGSMAHSLGAMTLANPAGAAAPPFSVVSGDLQARTLQPDATSTIAVRCTPPEIGMVMGALSIPHMDPKKPSPIIVPLTCRGIDTKIDLSPTKAQFPTTRVGETVSLPMNVKNSGNIDETLVAVTLENQQAGLELVTPPSNVLLAPDAQTTVTLRYTPAGEVSSEDVLGELVLTFASEEPRRLPITAEAVLADVDSDPPSLDLEAVCVGKSASLPVAVYALDDGAFQITGVTQPGGGFSLVTAATLPAAVKPNRQDQVAFTATVTPAAEGPIEGTAIIHTDAPTEPMYMLPLKATGLPEGVAVRPQRIVFPAIRVQTPSFRRVVKLSNCHGDPVELMSATIDGPDRESFHFSDEVPARQLTPTASVSIGVQVTPREIGQVRGRLALETTAGMLYVDLEATGLVDPDATRDSYYACAVGHAGASWPLLAALGFVIRRRRRAV